MSFFHHWFLPHHSNNQRARLLHPSSIAFMIVGYVCFQLLIFGVSQHHPAILGYASQIAPSEIIRITNDLRQAQGLKPVVYNDQLARAAGNKASDMLARDYWAHVSPLGVQPWSFITSAGYTYRYAGENLARDFADPNSVVQAWMNSPSHRDNLLSSRYEDIGVAVVDGKLEGRETTLVVQMFGTRLSAQAAPQTAGLSVKAAEISPPPIMTIATPHPTPAPTRPIPTQSQSLVKSETSISPFNLSKVFSLSLLILIAAVLAIDIIVVHQRKITRWTGKSLAHFLFISALIIAAATILRGKII